MKVSLGRAIKRSANGILKRFGYEITRTNKDLSLHAALERVLSLCPPIRAVIDVGASDGRWSREVQQFLPSASYLLIEANPYHRQALSEYKVKCNNVEYVLAAAGDKLGEVNFDTSSPFGGLATDLSREEFGEFNLQGGGLPQKESFIRLPQTTIDHEVARCGLAGPVFLKLDVHGYEVPIFEGAAHTLSETSLLQVEMYNFNITGDVLRFAEMIRYLEDKGLRVLDLCDPVHRSKDHAFWQVDFFLVPQSNPVFRNNTFA